MWSEKFRNGMDKMEKMLALADCNNFFVSCEVLKNPSLRGKAVCVLSNCDGCVVSRSQEAKDMGISMGMPFFMAKRDFPDAVYLSGDMKTYLEISKRFQNVLRDFTPDVEVCSVDEAFMDVTKLYKLYNVNGYEKLAEFLHKKLMQEVGIPVSVGISTSKILCKVAADKAKKGKFYYFLQKNMIGKEVEEYPVEKLWGVGKNTVSLLKSHGIYTGGDILRRDKEFFSHYMGKRGMELKFGVSGENSLPLVTTEAKPKSIQKTSSFRTPTNEKTFLKNSILEHLHNACRKMRKYELTTSELTIMLRTKDFRIISVSDVIENPTNAEYLLNKKAVELFEQIYSRFNLYRSSGVYLGGLKDDDVQQLSFFENNDRYEKISQIWDKVEAQYGRGIFQVGNLQIG